MDGLVRTMVALMLDHARSADELHEAVEKAVDEIESHPNAASVDDIPSADA